MLLPLLRVVAISVVLAVLGVLYILVNPHDRTMVGFGWFLVVVGSIIAGAFLFVWARRQMTGEEGAAPARPGAAAKGRARGGERTKVRPRRRR